ncbi:MAG: hypothetical protein PF693_10805 [Spirochaetia bacterium]|nr:hypothetical protein [Spirochaetia bacterium]
MDREWEFYILLIKISFIPLILLPDQSNLRDDRFLIDDVKESKLK